MKSDRLIDATKALLACYWIFPPSRVQNPMGTTDTPGGCWLKNGVDIIGCINEAQAAVEEAEKEHTDGSTAR